MDNPPQLDVRWRGGVKDMSPASSPVNVSWPEYPVAPFQYAEGGHSLASHLSSGLPRRALVEGAHPPYHVTLTPHNTAYQMILVGPPKRQVLAAITALQLRATDSERDILLQVKEPLTEPLMEVMEQLGVKVQQMEYHSMQQMEFDFGQCCSQFWACWMKLLTWNETRYKAVMNIDTDFLVLRNMGRAFDILGDTSQTPFDVGGVADPIVASTHGDTTKFDVLNGGMFMALPGREAYELMVSHAHSHKWEWGEMLWLNTFAANWGHWVRLPLTFNIFPILLRPGSPYLHYSPTNWDSIYGLHFAGISKVWGDATRKDCEERQTSDCVECCYKWVDAAGRLNDLLNVNKDIAAGKDGNATLARLLPSGWQDNARGTVLRNAARGYTFDKHAYHDGYTGGTWAEREAREALERTEKEGGVTTELASGDRSEKSVQTRAPQEEGVQGKSQNAEAADTKSLVGPPIMDEAFRDKCFSVQSKDVNGDSNVFTLCDHKTITQKIVDKGLTFTIGALSKWHGTVSDNKEYLSASVFQEGDKCSDTIRRSAYLAHHCNESASMPTLASAREVEMCVYVLDFFSREWCMVTNREEFVLPQQKTV